MRTIQLLTLLILLSPLSALAQTDTTRFVNKGKMHVASIPGKPGVASLYIPHGVRMTASPSIVQNGVTAIGGNFYQDSDTAVFALDATNRNFTRSTGTVRFFGQRAATDTLRAITVWHKKDARYSGLEDPAFDRSKAYIAFPNIEINTPDTIHVPFTMGMDAINITRGSSGVLYLESNLNTEDDLVYDASLRTTGTSVDPGAVVIEKYVLPFRHTASANTYLFPFATPYTNQRAGYFAGNWVRAPKPDANDSYYYPYGNMKSTTGQDFIDASQYVHGANDLLNPSSPYLLKLQPDGYTYDQSGDFLFILTGGEDHDLDKFVFNGTPYNLAHTEEQKFTGNLLSRTPVDGQTTAGGKTQNWLTGNSYTSALSIDSIIDKIGNSDIEFSSTLYIYPHGATGYQTYTMSPGADIPDIPAMSVFMLVVTKDNTETSEIFTITPQMQVHSGGTGASNGLTPSPSSRKPDGLQSAPSPANRLSFTLTTEDNPFIYDRAQVQLNFGALAGSDSWDVTKLLNTSNQYFQLYSQSGQNKLQTNALPLSTEQAALCVVPPAHALDCRLTVEETGHAETGHATSLLLHDTKTNAWTDLRETPEYVFTSEPGDSPDRFTVYFKTPTGINTPTVNTGIYAYYGQGQLIINRLTEEDKGSHLKVYSTSGTLIKEAEIDSYPGYTLPLSLSHGVYIAKIEGSRSTVIKFIKR